MGTTRIEKLRCVMDRLGLDGMLVTSPANRRYLTRFTGSAGYVLITGSDAILFSDFRYRKQANDEVQDCRFVEHAPNVIETIQESARSQGVRRLGVEQHHMTVAQYFSYKEALQGIEIVPTANLVETIRAIKEPSEIAELEQAAVITDETFKDVLSFIREGITEKEIAIELEYRMRQRGAAAAAYSTIVVSGERTCLPHGSPTEKRLALGDFVTMDFGANVGGYLADLTRTIVIGTYSERQQDLYQVVLEANMTAIDGIRPGMTGKEADTIARDVIKRYGYGDYFGHGLGHGIGLEIHEITRLSQQSDIVLQPGMVITVEPGVYVPEFGGVRIEDDIVITENGVRLLTHSDKQLIITDES